MLAITWEAPLSNIKLQELLITSNLLHLFVHHDVLGQKASVQLLKLERVKAKSVIMTSIQ